MTYTESKYADLCSPDDQIRVPAILDFQKQLGMKPDREIEGCYNLFKAIIRSDPKFHPTQTELLLGLHGYNQLLIWLSQAEKRFPHFDLVIHYKIDETLFGHSPSKLVWDLGYTYYFKPKLHAPYSRTDQDHFFDEHIDYIWHAFVSQFDERPSMIDLTFNNIKSENDREYFRENQRYSPSDLEFWGCRESSQHQTLRQVLADLIRRFS